MSKEWINLKSRIPMDNKNFQEIVQFFLFECPVEHMQGSNKQAKKVSQRGKTLRERGWERELKTRLLEHMKERISLYHFSKNESQTQWDQLIKDKGKSLEDEQFEVVIYKQSRDKCKTDSILYHIRNALAHGSFSYNAGTYYFECSNNKDTLMARIRLQENTLLEWKRLINMEPKDLMETKEVQKKDEQRKQQESLR